MEVTQVAVIGGGSFGTAIASILATNGLVTRQWMRNPKIAEAINKQHENPQYLPDVELHPSLEATTDLAHAITGAQLIFVSVPSKSFRTVVQQVKPLLQPGQCLISTTKGIEPNGFNLMSQVLIDECPGHSVAVLSGPNLAKEIGRKQLAATVVASSDGALRIAVQNALGCDYFRVYASDDMYGVELSGALKNIYAIVSGFIAALGMGENTKSMIITRSLAEMSRFAVAQGANPLTFLGLAGVGDLVVTCMSPLSRNYRVGYAIGEGKSLEQAVEELGEVAEGVNTLRYINTQSEELGIYMPLVKGAYAVLFADVDPRLVAKELMMGENTSDVEFTLAKSDIGV
ncbi:glycerol-3-phosphate dehydrogenase [Oleispira antarctica]|uniref:Glycerol-3-phosphate dehydrogenase [NAD(P)+] n=1 Tax=Oleispira antarctica TaxID=188908 RepID=A0A1Y5HJV1_OLEAN|nr:glycerol-3-phosphate dehydrogenase [Oleispira antarctica]